MTPVIFANAEESHAHSLQTLNLIYEYDDFMESIGAVVDMGCGTGLDLEWWATRTTRDDTPRPLNIRCLGVDVLPELSIAHKYLNIQYHKQQFEEPTTIHKSKFDVIWCHDAFQYVIDPFATLAKWWNMLNNDGMLVLILPQTVNIEFNVQAFDQRDGCYYNWTMVSLLHTLATSGFDCAGGFFKKQTADPWLHAVVYKSKHTPKDPRTTKWWDLIEAGLLPETVANSFSKNGQVRQRDLVLPWLDRNLTWLGQE